jgi:AcrR family transcriptional regulator
MFDNVLCSGVTVNNQSPPVRSQTNVIWQAVRQREAPLSAATTDRRVRRTRELLRRALFSLIQEQGYDRITVQDLLDRADIGRSTFYAHYRDKDDLLQSAFEDIRSALAAEREAAEQAPGATSQFLQPLLVVFRHVEGHRHVWQPLTRKGGAEVVTRIMRDNVTELVRAHLRSQFPGLGRNQPQLEAAVQFVAGACLGLLIWWLDNDVPYSAEKLYAIFRRLTTQGVRRFLIAS